MAESSIDKNTKEIKGKVEPEKKNFYNLDLLSNSLICGQDMGIKWPLRSLVFGQNKRLAINQRIADLPLGGKKQFSDSVIIKPKKQKMIGLSLKGHKNAVILKI